MATYAVGDIHGCYRTFLSLLEQIEFDPHNDRILHTGDLVNGGPDSLAVLRWFYHHQDHSLTVLGNHDLHLLAVAAGTQKRRSKDKFRKILKAPDAPELLHWLRHCPILHLEGSNILVHAGLLPQWSVPRAQKLASEVEKRLRKDPVKLFKRMYGNKPRRWQNATTTRKRLRITINAMTRMRVLEPGDRLEFSYSGTYKKIPKKLYPWFEAPERAWHGHRCIVGHWSALGLHQTDDLLALDTGCRWGRLLTACRLEDNQIFQVPSLDT